MNIDFFVRKAVISDVEDIYYINKTSLGYDYDFEKQKRKIGAFKKAFLKFGER